MTATLSTASDTTRRTAGTTAVLAVCLGFFLVMLDTTIVTVALPRIAADVGGGTSTLQWVVDSYTVVFAALVLTGGALADRLGARRVSVYGMLLFGLGSVFCAGATAGWMLAVARGVQGVGAAVLLPASLALIRSTFPDPRRQARVIGIWGGLGGVAAAAGPLLGALLITAVGWPTLFLLHVPFVVLAVVLVLRSLAETPVQRGTPFDVAGQASSFAALVLLVAGLIELGHAGIVGVPLMMAGAVLLGVFAFVERRVAEPMLAADMLRHRGLRATVLTGFMLNFGFYGQFFLVTLYLQQERHASVLFTGMALAIQAAGAIIGSPVGGWATHRLGARPAMAAGLVLGAAGFLLLAAVRDSTPLAGVLAALFVIGFGIDLAMTAATALTLQVAPDGRAGVASGLLNTMRQVGSALGVAALGAIAAAAPTFTTGFSVAMLAAAASYVVGLLLVAAQ